MDSRRGGRRWSDQTLLPVRSTRQLSSTFSCWYCDFKFLAFNEPLFHLGRTHSRLLRVWFSMGIGFSLSVLLGVTLIILCQIVRVPLLYVGYDYVGDSLVGLFSLFAGYGISLPSMGYLCVSSVICVIVHEFGHALAAASEGVRLEYVAIFCAVLFPGALVAFNHASLKSLPGLASLRIYCAGIWHNAAFCAVCILALLLLPFILTPFYVHGERPMVLDVPSVSPLSDFLSPHDVIYALDDINIHTAEEWKQTIVMLTEESHSGRYSGIANARRGYCVPLSLIEESTRIEIKGNRTICPNEFVAFAPMTCPDVSNRIIHQERKSIYCLDAKDVIKLERCGYGSRRNRSNCLCSEVESCLTPIQLPGLGWVEITYSSLRCHNHGTSLSFPDDDHSSSSGESNCLQTFVFIGDLISMSHSILLTSYQPRWSVSFSAYLPNMLEKLLTCSFHVSLVLALLNSLPVYFLDGESILEETLNHYTRLSSWTKRMVLRCCLLMGTFISTYFVLQIIFVSVT